MPSNPYHCLEYNGLKAYREKNITPFEKPLFFQEHEKSNS